MAGYPYNPVGESIGEAARKLRKGLGETLDSASPGVKAFVGIPDSKAPPVQKNLDVYNPYGKVGASVDTPGLGYRPAAREGLPTRATPAVGAGARSPQVFNPDLQPSLSTGRMGSSAPVASSLMAPPQQESTSPPKQFNTVLPGGTRYSANGSGDRTYQMGSPGQDGFGKMTVKNGQVVPRQGSALGSVTKNATDQFNANPVAASPGGFRVHDTVVDANSPDYSGMGKNPSDGQPKLLGPESGIGWKTRNMLYAQQMEQLGKQGANQTAMGIASLRERGDNSRAMLGAEGENARNQLARESQVQQGELARLGLNQKAQQFGAEQQRNSLNDRAERALKDSSVRKNEMDIAAGKNPQIQKLAVKDDMGQTVREDLYQVNKDGTTTRLQERGGDSRIEDAPTDTKGLKVGEQRRSPTTGKIGTWNGKSWDL